VILAGDRTEELQDEHGPQLGEILELQGGRMEEVEETAVLHRPQEAGAHKARDTEQICADGEAYQDETHPHEGAPP
jgi:hypothetical protein